MVVSSLDSGNSTWTPPIYLTRVIWTPRKGAPNFGTPHMSFKQYDTMMQFFGNLTAVQLISAVGIGV